MMGYSTEFIDEQLKKYEIFTPGENELVRMIR
jgi:hypothetical protein